MDAAKKKGKGLKLDIPNFVGPNGPLDNVAQAYGEAVLAGSEALKEISEDMNSISASLEVIALYCERRGQADSIFEPDDLKMLSQGDDEDEDEKDNTIPQ